MCENELPLKSKSRYFILFSLLKISIRKWGSLNVATVAEINKQNVATGAML